MIHVHRWLARVSRTAFTHSFTRIAPAQFYLEYSFSLPTDYFAKDGKLCRVCFSLRTTGLP